MGFAFWKKINNLLPIVIAVGAALATLVVKLIAIPALLSITTSGFAIASAGTSAIAVAKAFDTSLSTFKLAKLLPPSVDEALSLVFHLFVVVFRM